MVVVSGLYTLFSRFNLSNFQSSIFPASCVRAFRCVNVPYITTYRLDWTGGLLHLFCFVLFGFVFGFDDGLSYGYMPGVPVRPCCIRSYTVSVY